MASRVERPWVQVGWDTQTASFAAAFLHPKSYLPQQVLFSMSVRATHSCLLHYEQDAHIRRCTFHHLLVVFAPMGSSSSAAMGSLRHESFAFYGKVDILDLDYQGLR